jgi:hypothetical protein
MNKYVAIIGLILLAVAGAVWTLSTRIAVAPIEGQACTKEAKICSDGSAVGRSGPNCEFAACPEVAPTPTPVPTPLPSATSTPIAIGARATVRGTTIGVLELVEDSRCPVDVQCVWAGTVRVRASINDSAVDTYIFNLSEQQVVGNARITLVSVLPEKKNSAKNLTLGDYRFVFTVAPI